MLLPHPAKVVVIGVVVVGVVIAGAKKQTRTKHFSTHATGCVCRVSVVSGQVESVDVCVPVVMGLGTLMLWRH